MPDQMLFGEKITHPVNYCVIWDNNQGRPVPDKYKDVAVEPMTLKEFLSEPQSHKLVIYIGDGKVKVGDLPEALRCTEWKEPEKKEKKEDE